MGNLDEIQNLKAEIENLKLRNTELEKENKFLKNRLNIILNYCKDAFKK